jgi:hypothetical protein
MRLYRPMTFGDDRECRLGARRRSETVTAFALASEDSGLRLNDGRQTTAYTFAYSPIAQSAGRAPERI